MTFDDLKFEPHESAPQFRIQATAFFPNGYGASVVQGPASYGGPEGLYELAVLQGTSRQDMALTYDTPITDDVLGRLTPEMVTEHLHQIEALDASQ